MALHDVDNTSGDRGSPSPNGNDGIGGGQRMAHNTVSTSYKSTGSNPQGVRFRQYNNGFIGYDSTNTPRILIGQSPDDGRIGVWVSKTGYNVLQLLGGS